MPALTAVFRNGLDDDFGFLEVLPGASTQAPTLERTTVTGVSETRGRGIRIPCSQSIIPLSRKIGEHA